ncbi:STAS domain-containing protein [Sphaerisporangium sp. B11E5]|uniref:STAS domain-containing protein n=1 Tax=Sphaerisporangium sp. B11E5 TaxID=3153563 RepID=UPI00325EB334
MSKDQHSPNRRTFFQIDRQSATAATVLTVRGDLDHGSFAAFQQHINDLFTEPSPSAVIIDVSGVDFCDSSGVAALLACHRHLARQGGELVLVGADGRVARLLEITNLVQLFRLYPTLEQAQVFLADQCRFPQPPTAEEFRPYRA